MRNFLKGFASIFNLFPQTDYMSMVPKEGELLDKAQQDVAKSMQEAHSLLIDQYNLKAYSKNKENADSEK